MRAPFGLSGCTSCMNCVRRPRLNKAVVMVATLTVLSLSRVAGFSGTFAPSEYVGLADWRAKLCFQKIEIAAFVRLLDVARVHPAVTALEAWRRRLPCGAAPLQFRIG